MISCVCVYFFIERDVELFPRRADFRFQLFIEFIDVITFDDYFDDWFYELCHSIRMSSLVDYQVRWCYIFYWFGTFEELLIRLVGGCLIKYFPYLSRGLVGE